MASHAELNALEGQTCSVGVSRFSLAPSAGSLSFLPAGTVPERSGARPKTNSCIPHAQLADLSPPALHTRMLERVFGPTQPFVASTGPHPSVVSVPDTLAHHMREGAPCTHPIMKREWAHIHGVQGGTGSWHANLSEADAAEVLARGWAERHLLAGAEYKGLRIPTGLVLVYAPRDEAEADIVMRIIAASYAYACTE